MRVKPGNTIDIDADKIGRHPLPVKRVNPACLAEKVARGFGVELIFGQLVCPSEQLKIAFVHLHHQRVLAAANRTVAGRQFWEIGRDCELHRAAMATASMPPKRSRFTQRKSLNTCMNRSN